MTPQQIIEKILLGGLLGLLGQGIRMAIGLKKLSDANAQTSNKEDLNGGRLMVSLFIGFLAGALYVLVNGFSDQPDVQNGEYIGNQFVFTVIAAGYAGSDFIEGLFSTYIAKMPMTNSGSGGVAVATTSPVDVTPVTAPDTPAIVSPPSAENTQPVTDAQVNEPHEESGLTPNPA